jgi:hypothetical protein
MYWRVGAGSLRNLVLCAHFLPEERVKTICNHYDLNHR